jgi:peptidyl-prolyl cis-trans isomerase B (cyclophilin B)
MKIVLRISLTLVLFLIAFSCNKKPAVPEVKEEQRQRVEMITDRGTMVIELYNETPLHRDNFIKLANDKAYDSLLFHRVIEKFMIQGGDPDSKTAQPIDTLGNGGLNYTVAAEFNPNLFHKKGVLAAARDGNLERASSSMQFYIVQGKVFNDSLLDRAEVRINNWLAEHYFKNDPANKPLIDSLQKAIDNENMEQYSLYNDSISSMAGRYTNFDVYTIPQAHREIYKTVGGTPHLDQNYTVYGEVVEGFEVIDSIAAVPTGTFDRPLKDVRIISVRAL